MVIAVLAMLGMLRHGDMRYSAKAASVAGDIRVVVVAAFNYEAEHGAWPGEAGPGAVPRGMAPFLPGIEFSNADRDLDWDNFGVSGSNYVVGVTVSMQDKRLLTKVIAQLGSKYPYFVMGNQVTYVLEEASAGAGGGSGAGGRGPGAGGAPPPRIRGG